MDSDIKYLQMQAELGTWEVVLPASLCLNPDWQDSRIHRIEKNDKSRSLVLRSEPAPLLQQNLKISRGVPEGRGVSERGEEPDWQSASGISDFYNSIKTHSVYTKRNIEFFTPIAKINSPYILIFDSPMELTDETKNILDRLFKKLGKEINDCSISYFFKCQAKAMPREKTLLADMLKKEIELINPNKIVFFNIENKLKTFAGKPTITLYSPLELLSDKPNFKEKMVEVLNICREGL